MQNMRKIFETVAGAALLSIIWWGGLILAGVWSGHL